MKSFFLLILALSAFLLTNNSTLIGTETGLKIPRFVSLKSNDSNIRIGSSDNYPIKLKYISLVLFFFTSVINLTKIPKNKYLIEKIKNTNLL